MNVKKILTILPALLLFSLLSPVSIAQRELETPPPPRGDTRQRVPLPPEAPSQAGQELQGALQDLNRIVQQARNDNNSLARELQTVVQRLQNALRTELSARPATQLPTPSSRNPMNAEVEKVYIDLARQYFFVFTAIPAVAPPVPPTRAGTLPSALVAEETVMATAEEAKRNEREEAIDNFVECFKKISLTARIILLSELIRMTHTSEELKLLEGLLDEVSTSSTTNRVPTPGRPAQFEPMRRPN